MTGRSALAFADDHRVVVNLDLVEPVELEELAAVLRERQWQRAARLAEIADRPALGFYRADLRRARWVDAT